MFISKNTHGHKLIYVDDKSFLGIEYTYMYAIKLYIVWLLLTTWLNSQLVSLSSIKGFEKWFSWWDGDFTTSGKRLYSN